MTDFLDLSQVSGARGYVARDFKADPRGVGVSRSYDGPRLENDQQRFDLIADKDRNGEWWDLICRDCGMGLKNQGQTNSCWMQSTTMLVESVTCIQGLPFEPLSATSVAALINNGRDVGGWCSQALKGGIQYGWATEKEWRANSFDLRQNTPQVRDARKVRTVLEFDDLNPHDSRLLIDKILLDGPCAVANLRWQHATLAIRVGVYTDKQGRRRFKRIDWNSGYGRNAQGITELDESWFDVDEAVGIRVTRK